MNESVEAKTVCIEPSWYKALPGEFEQAYMQSLRAFLQREKTAKKVIYPPGKQIFHAFDVTPLDNVKVVILGQDPYHGPHQAHGLCFSVPPDVAIPPSLHNIYKELKADLGVTPPSHGCLTAWAKQGVLLLNSVLTVEARKPASHQGKGWETFTDSVIAMLNDNKEGVAFVLWGAYAQRKGAVIDTRKHLVIKSVHPSPLSAHRGFLGSRPFSKINRYLVSKGRDPIEWSLPESTEVLA